MQKNECVSIVVPIYNQEAYLDISIPSLIHQTWDNLEILLVNDGSTDKSMDIVRRYAAQDPRIRVIEKENGGLVDATLAGVAAATGEYLCFLDPDDYLGEKFVETFMNRMTAGCDFIAAGFYYDNHGAHTPYGLREDRAYSAEELRESLECFLHEPGIPGISNRFFISRWNKLYRMSLVKTVAEEFARCRGVSLGEDTVFTYLMLCHSRGGKTIAEPNGYYYNIGNQNSMMKSGQAETQIGKARTVYGILKEFTEAHGAGASQAEALYYFLMDGVFQRAQAGDGAQFGKVFNLLRQDEDFQRAKAMTEDPPASRREAILRRALDSAKTPKQYLSRKRILSGAAALARKLRK